MRLYGIRQVEGDKVTPLSILGRVMVSGSSDGVTDRASLEAEAAISVGAWGRRTLFVTYDLAFAAEVLLDDYAEDFREYFELRKSFEVTNGRAYLEVYDVLTGQRVEVNLDDPELSDLKALLEHRNCRRESRKVTNKG
jgi:hypothetical protein